MQENDYRNDTNQSDAEVTNRLDRPDAAASRIGRLTSRHGTSSFERIVTLGAFAALDEVPPEKPDAIRGYAALA